MAWYEGTMTAAAGELKAILDAKLPLNSKWHIEDVGAGANIGVYHNLDAPANVDYIFVVKDNQANFATVELWQGWDSGAHAGTGQSLTLASGGVRTLSIIKSAGAYRLRVRNHNAIFIHQSLGFANYIGQLARYDESKNMPILICHNSYATNPGRNPLGCRNNDTADLSNCSWRCLFDSDGLVRTLLPYADRVLTESDPTPGSIFMIRTIQNKVILFPHPVYAFGVRRLMGVLDGVGYTGVTVLADTLTDGDVAWVGMQGWLMVRGGNYGSIIEMA